MWLCSVEDAEEGLCQSEHHYPKLGSCPKSLLARPALVAASQAAVSVRLVPRRDTAAAMAAYSEAFPPHRPPLASLRSVPPSRPHSRPRRGAAGQAPWRRLPVDASRLLRPLCRAQLAGRSCRPLPETRGRGGAGPHRGLPGRGARGAGGVRRGAGGRGRASRGGREGRGKALIMFRGKGSLPAREPGARRRPRRSPPLGR